MENQILKKLEKKYEFLENKFNGFYQAKLKSDKEKKLKYIIIIPKLDLNDNEETEEFMYNSSLLEYIDTNDSAVLVYNSDDIHCFLSDLSESKNLNSLKIEKTLKCLLKKIDLILKLEIYQINFDKTHVFYIDEQIHFLDISEGKINERWPNELNIAIEYIIKNGLINNKNEKIIDNLNLFTKNMVNDKNFFGRYKISLMAQSDKIETIGLLIVELSKNKKLFSIEDELYLKLIYYLQMFQVVKINELIDNNQEFNFIKLSLEGKKTQILDDLKVLNENLPSITSKSKSKIKIIITKLLYELSHKLKSNVDIVYESFEYASLYFFYFLLKVQEKLEMQIFNYIYLCLNPIKDLKGEMLLEKILSLNQNI